MPTQTTRSSKNTQQGRRWRFLRFQTGVNYKGVNRSLLNRLNRLGQALGQTITITSGYRTYAEQQALYNKYQHGGNIAAKPGRSLHESGRAVDAVIDGQALSSVVKAAILRKYGLAAPVQGDPVHIQLLGGSGSSGGTSFQQFVNQHTALKPYAGLIKSNANKYGLDPLHFAALIFFESGGNTKARSYADAVGLAQIHLPSHPGITRAQAEDPAFALNWGAKYFAGMLKKYGSYDAAYFKGYNPGYQGPGPFDGLSSDYSGDAMPDGGGTGPAPAAPGQAPPTGFQQTSPLAGEAPPPNSPPMVTPPQPAMSGSDIQSPFENDISTAWRLIAEQPLSSPETRKFAGLDG